MEGTRATKKFIKCPHCGWEYEPSEVLYPDKVFGHPKNVIRDSLGHIIYTEYEDDSRAPSLTEEFYCEGCNKPFVVELEILYRTREQDDELDFSSTTSTLF